MNGDYRARPGGYFVLRVVAGNIQRRGIDIHQHRARAGERNGFRGSSKRVRRYENLVPSSHSAANERKMQRRGT